MIIDAARAAVRRADALLITAGAGMGVDSGLPDFRGDTGFWKAYPPYERLGYPFVEMANPARFTDAPALAWGFYGHRLHLYLKTKPHPGFAKILTFSQSHALPTTVFTSNVDGHFQSAGFEENHVTECHGSIRHLQCLDDCSGKIWGADSVQIEIDESTMEAKEPLPHCPDCGGLTRPAILMFDDGSWNGARTFAQMRRAERWCSEKLAEAKSIVIIEFGAGTAVPSVRMYSEKIARLFQNRATLIRVNPREAHISSHLCGATGICLELGALSAIEKIF